MTKKKQKILLFLLFIFSAYCALTIGRSWDEFLHLHLGKSTYDYLFSFGSLDKEVFYREFYSSIYWFLQYFVTKISTSNYQIETMHFVNLTFSFAAIFGFGKVCRELFNKKIGQIAFLILFFYPIFFGHMGFNPKDTILAFCHVWIFYLILRYIKKQNINFKSTKYIVLMSLLAATSTGIQLVFLGSMISILLFILADIFIFKKISNKRFKKKKFLFDLIKGFLIFYFVLTLFWIDTHPNIFENQKNIFLENLSEDHFRGWPFNLLNGEYFYSKEIPKLYFLKNLLFKSPEFFLFLYIIFPLSVLTFDKFFTKNFKFFYYKLTLIFLILLLPNLILFFIPFPVYDGARLFLWAIPYYCIIPALAFYYLIKNSYNLIIIFVMTLSLYFFYNFVSFTPYQYTYLNSLNGNFSSAHKRFENDYWGGSLKELIKKSDFLKERKKIAYCGVNKVVIEFYLSKYYSKKIELVDEKQDYDVIIMTNRTLLDKENSNNYKLKTCFDKYHGKDLSTVKRNGLVLSTIREK